MSQEMKELEELTRLLREARIELQQFVVVGKELARLKQLLGHSPDEASTRESIENTPQSQIDAWFRKCVVDGGTANP